MTTFIAKISDIINRHKCLDMGKYPRQKGLGPAVSEIEKQLESMPHLEGDRRHEEDRDTSHECRDARQIKTAVEALARLPDSLETFHLLCSGRFAMWDIAGPAILELAYPHTIASMTIATLGFSKPNITEMVQMMDAGKIGSLSLLASHYFKGTSKGIYEYAEAELSRRPAARFASVRNHAKIAAIKLTDGRTITIESSANLRSCKNLEFMTINGHPGVYDFHTAWINELFNFKGVHRDRG